MDKITRNTKLVVVALAALAIVLVFNAPGQARGMAGHGFGGGHSGVAQIHHGSDGHRGSDGHHGFDGRHDHDRRGRFGFGSGFVYPYYGYYPQIYYWYYCPSYGAYYPYVASCPEAWVPVPAS